MKKYNVLVTQPIPEAGLAYLKKELGRFEIHRSGEPLGPEGLRRKIKGRDGVLCLLTDKMDAGTLAAAGPGLRVVSNCAVGYDNIDVTAATRSRILVTNTPGVLTRTTAEMAWALLFAAARRIPESDAYIRSGRFKRWDPMLFHGRDVSGKTLGVVGAGRIGTAFALMSRGFGMDVLYFGRKRNPELETALNARKVPLRELLKKSDFVSVHVSLNPETRHLIGEKELNMMKPSAILVNTARGPVIDEAALVRALKRKRIFAAGLDVYEHEPRLAQGLDRLSNAALAPHTASATVTTRDNMALTAARNLVAALRGQRPEHLVNPEAFHD